MFRINISIVVYQRKHGDAKGGPYIGAHLRRADFAISRAKDVPTIKQAAKNITELLEKYSLTKVFVATDSNDSGRKQFLFFLIYLFFGGSGWGLIWFQIS